MKRDLLEAKLRLNSAIARLEDMRAVFPDARKALDAVLEIEFRRALEHVAYALSVTD